MRGDTGFIHGTDTDQPCHRWDADAKCWDILEECLAPLGDGFMGEGYCPTCGVGLRNDGAEVPRCDSVTPEAVRALRVLADEVPQQTAGPLGLSVVLWQIAEASISAGAGVDDKCSGRHDTNASRCVPTGPTGRAGGCRRGTSLIEGETRLGWFLAQKRGIEKHERI
jgi:hypothetical protein